MTNALAQQRYYVPTALPTTLAAALGPSGNPSVNSVPGTWPASYPYPVLIDWGTANAEVILVTGPATGSGPFTLPCLRGQDGTAAVSHAGPSGSNPGALVVHGESSYEPNLLQAAAGTLGLAAAGWLFDVTAYGALGNGQCVLDGAITSGQPTLTTVGLSAPSSPTVANAGSGAIGPGTYQAQVTYVNAYGETVASSSGSTTVSGTAATLTVSSPAISGNATGWYAYLTQANGSSYTRQQAPGSPTPIGVALVLSAAPTSSGAAPPGGNTTPSNPFKAGDVGKPVIVNGATGTGSAQVFTISAYNSAGSVTLSGNATTTVSGAAVLWGTDDTAAFQAAVNAAVTAAQASGYAKVWKPLPPAGLFYMIAGALVTTGSANAQIVIPNPPLAIPQPTLELDGPGAGILPLWTMSTPQLNGGLVSTGVWASTGAQSTNNAASGDSAVVGSTPAQASLLAQINSLPAFANIHVIVRNWTVTTPSAASGTNYAGISLRGCAKGTFDRCAALTTADYNQGSGPNQFPSVSGLINGLSAALIAPGNGNNAEALYRDCQTSGYSFALTLAEETVVDRCLLVGHGYAFKFYGADTISNAHGAMITGGTSAQKCYNVFLMSGTGAATGCFINADLDVEVISDANPGTLLSGLSGSGADLATLYGEIKIRGHYSLAIFPPKWPVNVKLISAGGQTVPGWVFSYAGFSAAGTTVAVQNPYWRDARVYWTGGTVTAVSAGAAIGGTGGSGTTAPSMTQVTTAAAGDIDWPAGGWLAFTFTGSPTWDVCVS